jgi:predicted MFS family arabinose efflux permease
MDNARKLDAAPSRRWLLVGWITAFVVGTDLFIVAPFLPSIGGELGIDPASLTILVSAFSLTYAVTCPLHGCIAERIGLNNMLCFGVLALGMANLYTAAAPDLFQLTLSRCVAGFAAASITPMLYALTAERVAPARRAASLALVNSGLILALAGGAPMGLMIGMFSGWRTVFGLLGGGLLLLFPVHLAIWQQAPAARVSVSGGDQPERLRDAAIFLATMIVWSIAIYASYTLVGTAIYAEKHWPVPLTAAMLACFGAGATLGALLGGRLADRIGPCKFVRLSFLLTSAGFTSASWIYGLNSAWALGAVLFLIALMAYGLFPALQACAAAVFVTRRPTVLGLMSSALYVGISIGASTGASLFSHGGMQLVLVASAVAAFIGFGLALRLLPRLPTAVAAGPAG